LRVGRRIRPAAPADRARRVQAPRPRNLDRLGRDLESPNRDLERLGTDLERVGNMARGGAS
jgi:hypothetical protein